MQKLSLDHFKKQFLDGLEFGVTSQKPSSIEIQDQDEFRELLIFTKEHNVTWYQAIDEQLNEYKEILDCFYGIKSTKLSSLDSILSEYDSMTVGELIYFPWKEKSIINSVNEKMYYDLVTWRNKDKITYDEQEVIRSKKIGIVGSSVGSFATKILAKLGFTNFNIAEIKPIKPSNTSRLYNDSIKDYGRHKLEPLSEGLYEYNPFLNLNLFKNGVDIANIEDFFNIGNDKIDILIDAADDGSTKLLLREYCRALKVPLVSGFDEKGALIVIRYDRPDSLIEDDFDFCRESLSKLKIEDKKEYVNKLLDFFPGGKNNLTERQLKTLEGIQLGTRGGFSQLAWEASFFAGYTSKAVVDICLDLPIQGKRLIDLDEYISKDMLF